MAAIALLVHAIQSAIDWLWTGDPAGASGSGSSFLGILTYAFITAPVTYATFQDLRGTRIGVGAMTSEGFSRVWRVVGATVCFGLLIGVPIVAAVFLAFIGEFIGIAMGAAAVIVLICVTVIWFVVIPVLVVEDVRFFSAFGRAAALSKGRRWGLLGLLLVYGMALLAVMAAMLTAVGLLADAPIVALIAMLPFLMFYSVVAAILPAVVYYLLRAEKEGVGIDQIASVFD